MIVIKFDLDLLPFNAVVPNPEEVNKTLNSPFILIVLHGFFARTAAPFHIVHWQNKGSNSPICFAFPRLCKPNKIDLSGANACWPCRQRKKDDREETHGGLGINKKFTLWLCSIGAGLSGHGISLGVVVADRGW
ncbi:MAG: hypothetical protein ACK5QW_07645 [Cyanobacteriota bacterium]